MFRFLGPEITKYSERKFTVSLFKLFRKVKGRTEVIPKAPKMHKRNLRKSQPINLSSDLSGR